MSQMEAMDERQLNRQGKAEGESGRDAADVSLANFGDMVSGPGMDRPLTLAEARQELGAGGWHGVDAAAEQPEFGRGVEREFPQHAGEWVDPVSRRGFMKLMGASLAMAGLAGCTKQPDEPIYPYIQQPEDLVLGRPTYFTSAHPFPTGAIPLLVKTDAYRPIKVDGNPDHPMSKGGSDPMTQGTLLGLYDPDRSQKVLERGEVSTFANFQNAFMQELQATGGNGVYILSATITSPTLAAQWKRAQTAYPPIKLMQYEPVNRDSASRASKAAFGDFYDTQYMLADADVVLSLDAGFLSGIRHPGFVKLSGDWANRRKLVDPSVEMNRLYVVESAPTTTGFKADHRLALPPSRLEAFSLAIANALGAGGQAGGGWTEREQHYLQAIVADLKAHAGRSAIIPGEDAPASVHLAAIAMNQALGNVGKTVVYHETVNPLPTVQADDLGSLISDLRAGKVQWLIMLDVNPVYSMPAEIGFADLLTRVPTSVHLGGYADETAQISTWHINSAHYLEMWSDARAYDGSVSIVQPMIDPLYGGHTAHHVLQILNNDPEKSPYEVIRANWQGQLGGNGDITTADTYLGPAFEEKWRKALHDGYIAGTAFQPKSLTANTGALAGMASSTPNAAGDRVEVIFRADPNIYDGRFSNNGWLQELPKPLISASWDNAVLMSQATLAKHKLTESDVVEIAQGGLKTRGSVLAIPGHPEDSVTIYLGYGRQNAGRVGSGMGFSAYQVRSFAHPLFAPGATLRKTGDTYEIAVTKSHYNDDRGKRALAGVIDAGPTHSLEGDEALTRGIVRYATLDQFRESPEFAHEEPWEEPPTPDTSLFANYTYDANAWGMAIDQNSCVGCNACVISCYAENNIAVVGKHNVKVGRDMQWLRIDTYYEGDLAAPRAHFQPMLCQHCENAPCEQVCPVGATVHTPEGLNTMVYNRCVGTRYCSNNCPYKVRRFNFLLFSDYETESLKFMRNPDVSVRSRGVMEKCTYCVQRIAAAKIEADKENRAIRDGEITTACQQACPTDAIVFGNINDKSSRVAKLKAQTRNYGVLADQNTRPRTTYIAEVINTNKALSDVVLQQAALEG